MHVAPNRFTRRYRHHSVLHPRFFPFFYLVLKESIKKDDSDFYSEFNGGIQNRIEFLSEFSFVFAVVAIFHVCLIFQMIIALGPTIILEDCFPCRLAPAALFGSAWRPFCRLSSAKS